MKPNRPVINVGLIGLGTVGTGVSRIIEKHQDDLFHQTGYCINVHKILVNCLEKPRNFHLTEKLTANIDDLIQDPSIDIIIEVMGGVKLAKDYISLALMHHKHVVTANKDLMALHGTELLTLASQNDCDLYYEASVAGGIPIIRVLVEGLSSDRIHKLIGILNGTTNYMLSKMSKEGCTYEDSLQQAQVLGFAEADPSSDVDGLDSARKLCLLSTLAFHTDVCLNEVSVTGISSVTREDIEYGQSFGYELKLLAYAERTGHEITLSVQPTFVHKSHPLANVDDAYNAVYIYGETVGETMFYGPGAGELPTATAVVSDLVTVVKNMKLGVNGRGMVAPYREKSLKPPSRIINRYFIRLIVKDKPGVLAQLTHALAQLNISISKIVQNELSPQRAEVAIITHYTPLSSLHHWLKQMKETANIEHVISYYPVHGDV